MHFGERSRGGVEIEQKSPSSPKEVVLEKNEITRRRHLGGGCNKTEFVKIKDDGNGVFKPVKGERGVAKKGTGYKRERAAYLVDLFLGFGIVPPTVIRTIKGKVGSLQEFIPDAKERCYVDFDEFSTDDEERFAERSSMMELFDVMISNTDRRDANWLVDKDEKLWAIDHGYAFNNEGLPMVNSHKHEKGVLEKVKLLADSPDKQELLRKLLLELLESEEVDLFFRKLKIIAQNIKDSQIDEDVAFKINMELTSLHKRSL